MDVKLDPNNRSAHEQNKVTTIIAPIKGPAKRNAEFGKRTRAQMNTKRKGRHYQAANVHRMARAWSLHATKPPRAKQVAFWRRPANTNRNTNTNRTMNANANRTAEREHEPEHKRQREPEREREHESEHGPGHER